MADVVEPAPTPEPASPPPSPEFSNVKNNSASTGLPSNVAAALACFPLIGGIVFWALEKHDPLVRFYAWQSIIFGIAWVVFATISNIMFWVLGSIPAIGTFLVFIWSLIAAAVHIGFVVLWIIAMIKAFSGTRWEMPYVGPIAKNQVG